MSSAKWRASCLGLNVLTMFIGCFLASNDRTSKIIPTHEGVISDLSIE